MPFANLLEFELIGRDYPIASYLCQLVSSLRVELAIEGLHFNPSSMSCHKRLSKTGTRCGNGNAYISRSSRYDVSSDVLSEKTMHDPLKRRGGIAQAERHIVEHEKALVSKESCFWPVVETKRDLDISN